jgi:uncharacterized short protein YbdD (DUF466 family)
MLGKLRSMWGYRGHFMDLLVGVPSYEVYVKHRQEKHPGEPIVTRKQFFREAQEARYHAKGGKISRCC